MLIVLLDGSNLLPKLCLKLPFQFPVCSFTTFYLVLSVLSLSFPRAPGTLVPLPFLLKREMLDFQKFSSKIWFPNDVLQSHEMVTHFPK